MKGILLGFLFYHSLYAQKTNTLKDSLITELDKLKDLKSVTNNYLLLDRIPKGPAYAFCTSYHNGQIRQSEIFKNGEKLNDIVGVVTIYIDSTSKDKLIGLEINQNNYTPIKSIYVGQSIQYLREKLKDIIVYAADSKTELSKLILTTKDFHIVISHNKDVVTKIILTRVCV